MSTPQASQPVDVARILATIRTRESGGNYKARNPSSSASGAYQFIDSTWGGYGGFAHAYQAPVEVQDAKAVEHVQSILSRYGGAIESVPATWYVGHYDPSNMDYVPAGGNTLSVRQYVDKWMSTYDSIGASTPTTAGGGIRIPGLPIDAGTIVDAGTSAIPGLDELAGVVDFFKMLANPQTWLRVQAFGAGLALVALGVAVILSENEQIRAAVLDTATSTTDPEGLPDGI